MRKLALVIGVLLLLAVVLPAASRVEPGPATKATANGYLNAGDNKDYTRVIKAVIGKDGVISGTWKESDNGFEQTILITDLKISGNQATILGIVTDPIGAAGDLRCVKMIDDGNGNAAFDKMSGTALGWDCTDITMSYYDFVGSITIVNI